SALFGAEERHRQQEQQEDEKKNGCGYNKCAHEKFSAGQATSMARSKMPDGRAMPAMRICSTNLGRMRLGSKVPRILPSRPTPLRWNEKTSCIVIRSCSMPVISHILTSLRVPSDCRVSWITMVMADAICWRTAFSGTC